MLAMKNSMKRQVARSPAREIAAGTFSKPARRISRRGTGTSAASMIRSEVDQHEPLQLGDFGLQGLNVRANGDERFGQARLSRRLCDSTFPISRLTKPNRRQRAWWE